MKCLIAEDDSATRKLMQRWLSQVSDCDIAVNGIEAMDAFSGALAQGSPYDLICLDIMMPKMDGHQTLEMIRQIEIEQGIATPDSVKVIMTTALGDSKHVMSAFHEGCMAYIVKPVKKQSLLEEIEKLGLISIKAS
jgi:two-component system, chemotaxis family, chemotaxis protein CheY